MPPNYTFRPIKDREKMTVFPLTNQGLENVFVQNRRETCKKIQPITSQEATLSTNHVRAFSVTRDAETGFKSFGAIGAILSQSVSHWM